MTHALFFGEYRCQVNNSLGSIARDVHLLEGAKPGIPKLVTHRVHSENASFIIKVIYALQRDFGFYLSYMLSLLCLISFLHFSVIEKSSGAGP